MFCFNSTDLITHNPNVCLKKVASAVITVGCGDTFLDDILISFN